MWHAGLWWAPRHGDVAEPMQLGPYSAGIGPLRSKFHRFGRMRDVCGDQQPVTRPCSRGAQGCYGPVTWST
eukprot:scaffold103308_cov22-Phaeocystis_antarctica.AAC.1